jgi:hypothetical protein
MLKFILEQAIKAQSGGISTPSLTSTFDGVSGQPYASDVLFPGKRGGAYFTED